MHDGENHHMKEKRMNEESKMKSRRFEMVGRWVVTLECTDDLTVGERATLESWFASAVDQLQFLKIDGALETPRHQHKAIGLTQKAANDA